MKKAQLIEPKSCIDEIYKIDQTLPCVKITSPKRGWFYIFNFVRKTPIYNWIIIIGKINVTVNATDNQSGMNRVEFYVDDILQWSDSTEPHCWIWSDKVPLLFPYTLKVIAFDNAGNKNSDALKVWKVF